MPKRSPAGLVEVADYANLLRAFHLAARGKGDRWEVRRFRRQLDANLAALRRDILSGAAVRGDYRRFLVQDPKERVIHAVRFRERVLHHALVAVMEAHFERGHINHSYACRPGKGSLAAVQAAQGYAGRAAWHLHMDVRSYFASIDHGILKGLLRRRFKDPGLLGLCDAVLDGFPGEPAGTGLPIGSLTSLFC